MIFLFDLFFRKVALQARYLLNIRYELSPGELVGDTGVEKVKEKRKINRHNRPAENITNQIRLIRLNNDK